MGEVVRIHGAALRLLRESQRRLRAGNAPKRKQDMAKQEQPPNGGLKPPRE